MLTLCSGDGKRVSEKTAPKMKNEPSAQDTSRHLQKMMADIANEMEMLSEQQRHKLKLELATQARALCLSEISHDLRTPLNAIIGFTQLMESGIFGTIGNPQYNEYLRHIRESGYELLERIEDLLDTTTATGAPEKAVAKPKAKSARAREAVA